MSKFFGIIVSILLLVAGGCSSSRYTVMTLSADANAYDRVPFRESGANAHLTYRVETGPVGSK